MVNASLAQVFEKKLDSLLLSSVSQNQAGVAVLVVKDGQVIYKKGFGLANIATKDKITSKTNFRMASVSKQFTAACIVLLEKQHKLSYEDNLLKFFPDFNKDVGAKIKIKHLLTHTSGISDYENLIPANQKEQILDADVLAFLKNQSKTYFEAGSQFRYSNSGFCLLEQIVEQASGISFVAYVTKNIFKPLAMTNTSIYEATQNISSRAMGYARNAQHELVFSDQSITSATKGDGCVYTSLDDYLKWYHSVLSNQLVNILTELKKLNHSIAGTKEINYGLGWFNGSHSLNEVELYHTGSTCGFSNVVNIVPGKQFLFVCFSNIADNHQIEQPIRALLKQYKIDNSEIDFGKALSLTN